MKGFVLLGPPEGLSPEDNIVDYSRYGETTQFNGIEVGSITFSFYKNRFYCGKIFYDNYDKYPLLYKSLEKEHGMKLEKKDRPFPSYTLKFEKVEILIEYQPKNKKGYLYYTYLPIEREIEQDIHEKEMAFASSAKGKIYYQSMNYYAIGWKQLRNKEYEDSIKAFTQAISLNQGFKEAYCGRGEAYQKKGEKEKARADFQIACDLGDDEGCEKLRSIKK